MPILSLSSNRLRTQIDLPRQTKKDISQAKVSSFDYLLLRASVPRK